VGGSEQVLWHLDRALVTAGHRSLVIACEGSQTTGTLMSVPATHGPIDGDVIAEAWKPQRARIAEALRDFPVDVVHLHGIDFHAYLPPAGVPVLATLHLPPAWYPLPALYPRRPDTWLQCVSRSQQQACPPAMRLLPPIENGIDVAALQSRPLPLGNHALMLGRMCPEKGPHLAMQAAKRAGVPLFIGGRVFHYADHDRYFESEVLPRLDAQRRFLGPLGFRWKQRLLASARCLLVPSLADETSSLVAMEAIACGTPVIAYGHGALPEVVSHGLTGFIVSGVEEMAEAIPLAATLDRDVIRREAWKRFNLPRMTDRYLALYRQLAMHASPAEAMGAAWAS
jgi:glycosyltransferase involved in cell wall biosynthesis